MCNWKVGLKTKNMPAKGKSELAPILSTHDLSVAHAMGS